MGRIVLVTGGARSGKSTFAEDTVRAIGGSVLYIATSIPFDEEMKERVKRHKEQRPAEWETLEAYRNFDRVLENRLEGKTAALFDCITVMVANIMLEEISDWDNIDVQTINRIEGIVDDEIRALISTMKSSDVLFVVVTNELGSGVVPPYTSGRAMRDIAGRANQMLARAVDEVYLCVSGIPVKIKG